jgi:hypothetical protein
MENLKNYKRVKLDKFNKTISLSKNNHEKIVSLDIFLSSFINDFLENNSLNYLKENFNSSYKGIYNGKGITTSLSLKKHLKNKVDSVNITFLVNTLIDLLEE